MGTWVELEDNDAQHLRQHMRDALALHTYNDSWEQMAQRVWAAVDEGLLRTETPEPGKVGPHAVRLNDLVAAVRRAQQRATNAWASSNVSSNSTAYFGAMAAMDFLARELTHPERDGAGESSPATPPPEVATPTPAPSRPFLCDVPHPVWPGIRCLVVPGDHIERQHKFCGSYGTVITWDDPS